MSGSNANGEKKLLFSFHASNNFHAKFVPSRVCYFMYRMRFACNYLSVSLLITFHCISFQVIQNARVAKTRTHHESTYTYYESDLILLKTLQQRTRIKSRHEKQSIDVEKQLNAKVYNKNACRHLSTYSIKWQFLQEVFRQICAI